MSEVQQGKERRDTEKAREEASATCCRGALSGAKG
jgi:hypothetical protein